MKIQVCLPGQQAFEVVGTWRGTLLVNYEHVPTIRVQKAFRIPGGPFVQSGRHFATFPTAVLKDAATGEVLYNPRAPETYRLLLPHQKAWLGEHPGWPGDLVG